MFHGNIHRHLLVLSLVNWAIAVVCWTISAYLGSAAPTGIFVYTVLFVIGLFAVVVAIGSFVLATFGTEPGQPALASGVADPDAGAPAEPAAEKPAAATIAKASEQPAGKPADKPASKPADKPTGKPAVKPADKPAEQTAPKPADKPAEKPAEKPAAPGA